MSSNDEIYIATIDCETDPFKAGRIPKPFAVEYYSDTVTIQEWGDGCIDKIIPQIEAIQEPTYIFAHNGGKFDFHFMHKYIGNPITIINSRIVSASLFHHTFRDSWSILPVPLRDMQKDEIDYELMERHNREEHKGKILEYLHSDCVGLHKYVMAFIEQFGLHKTIGSTAMNEIKKRHSFNRITKTGDEFFRKFYFGGRVEVFKAGINKGPWKLYDVNSMYPYVMKTYKHPVNCLFDVTETMPDNFDTPFFLTFEGTNKGAIPYGYCECEYHTNEPKTQIDPTGRNEIGLDFNRQRGIFHACSHEIEVALAHNLITIDRVYECYQATETISFAEFVDTFNKQKIDAELAGDKAGRLFAKLLLNSGYGKFGQDPANHSDWLLARGEYNEQELRKENYILECDELTEFDLWRRDAKVKPSSFFDVSIAASITSAARSMLLRGLVVADTPIYCDTDSIICRDLGLPSSATVLGDWKLEASAPMAAIAGKKTYALYDPAIPYMARNIDRRIDRRRDKRIIKIASKGGLLTLGEVIDICKGRIVLYENDAPTFSLTKKTHFITRRFKMTVDDESEIE